MSSKNVRNSIIALITIAIGVWFLSRVGKAFLPKDSPIDFTSIFAAVEGMLNLFLVVVVILIIILIPVWISKKRKERQEEQFRTQPVYTPSS